MPASTSSKIRPGAESLRGRSVAPLKPWRDVAMSVLMASMTRDSSPPDTILASGRRSSPGLGETKNSAASVPRSEEHTSELQSPDHLVCRLLLEKKKKSNA